MEYFTVKERKDGSKFSTYREDCPDSVKDLCREIHFDIFDGTTPNDWVFDKIHEAFLFYDEYNDIDDFIYQVEADIAYCDLFEWLYNSFALEAVDEKIKEYSSLGLIECIQCAQCDFISSIRGAVAEFIENEANND